MPNVIDFAFREHRHNYRSNFTSKVARPSEGRARNEKKERSSHCIFYEL